MMSDPIDIIATTLAADFPGIDHQRLQAVAAGILQDLEANDYVLTPIEGDTDDAPPTAISGIDRKSNPYWRNR